MTDEFNLSESLWIGTPAQSITDDEVKIIKEFIKRVESEVITGNPYSRQMLIKLNLLAGDKLI